MFELLFCSLLTIFPDYLYRRYGQGKRLGHEITIYSVWFELRWGIIGCVLLTLALITTIFYYHPSTKNAVSFFRTVPILPEGSGRVSEVYVGIRDEVTAGQPIFKLDSARQEAQLETARRRSAEIDAELDVTQTELEAAVDRLRVAEGAYQQAQDELETRAELAERSPDTVPARQLEQLQVTLDERQGSVDEASANVRAIERKITVLLPARKASAQAALHEAEVALDKTTIRAGVDGRLEQFTLRVGDVINPIMRPAGILVPKDAGTLALLAGFGQIEAQVMKVGMTAEAICISKPFTVIPLVVTEVQDVIAAGQVRPTDQLIDALQVSQPGTLSVFLEPLYEGALEGVTPGSNCIANAYTSNHDLLDSEDIGTGRRLFLHAIDTVGLVHAMILRIQALVMPVRLLVLTGH